MDMDEKRRSLTLREIIGGLIGGAIGIMFAVYEDRDSAVFPVDVNGLPPKSLDSVAITIALAFFFAFMGVVTLKRRQGEAKTFLPVRPRLHRARASTGTSLLIWQLCLVGVVLWGFRHGGWDAASVGITPMHPIEAFAIGFFVYYLFILALQFILTQMGKLTVVRARNLASLAYIWPRSRRQKLYAFVAVCFLNPFTEELLFRGILVHQFHQLIGSLYLPLAVGLLVNLGNHLYQGPQAVFTHVPFYFLTVALLYSPAGLVGCFGFHFAGDWFPVVGMKKGLTLYRADYRKVKR
jgi:membrane protease YdiL (CAAX protease family)